MKGKKYDRSVQCTVLVQRSGNRSGGVQCVVDRRLGTLAGHITDRFVDVTDGIGGGTDIVLLLQPKESDALI